MLRIFIGKTASPATLALAPQAVTSLVHSSARTVMLPARPAPPQPAAATPAQTSRLTTGLLARPAMRTAPQGVSSLKLRQRPAPTVMALALLAPVLTIMTASPAQARFSIGLKRKLATIPPVLPGASKFPQKPAATAMLAAQPAPLPAAPTALAAQHLSLIT